jgi:hypothetical protein
MSADDATIAHILCQHPVSERASPELSWRTKNDLISSAQDTRNKQSRIHNFLQLLILKKDLGRK